jgi:hypothetical protein
MRTTKKDVLKYFSEHIIVVIGLVMIWRGIWYVLDGLEVWLFGSYSHWTGLAGIILGIIILYIPDKNLKEIEKI